MSDKILPWSMARHALSIHFGWDIAEVLALKTKNIAGHLVINGGDGFLYCSTSVFRAPPMSVKWERIEDEALQHAHSIFMYRTAEESR